MSQKNPNRDRVILAIILLIIFASGSLIIPLVLRLFGLN